MERRHRRSTDLPSRRTRRRRARASRRTVAALSLAVAVTSALAVALVATAAVDHGAPPPVRLQEVAADTELAPVSAPADVRLVASPRGDGVDVAWTPVTGATGYDLFRVSGTADQVPDGPDGWVRVNADPVTSSTVRDAGLSAGRPVTYTVKPRFPGDAAAATAELRRPVDLPVATAVPEDPLASYGPLARATCPSAASAPGTVVRSAAELTKALSGARPGDVVRLADGVYQGRFTLTVAGTAAKPFWLCGGPGAVLQTGDAGSGAALRVGSSSYVGLSGFSVRSSLQGVMIKGSSGVVVTGLSVSGTGYEGIHAYAFSQDVVIRGNRVERSGSTDVAFGEGIYIGTSDRRWDEVTGGRPDATHHVAVLDNTIIDAGAEPIEVKMGTYDGLVQGNTIRGHQPGSRAIGWVLVTGNDWVVRDNSGQDAVTNGYVLMRQGTEYGHDNSVVGNRGAVDASGWGVLLQRAGSPAPQGAVVGCDNDLTGAAAGVISGPCQN